MGYLRNADSGWTTSSEESLKLLLDTHFPLNRSTEEVPLGELQEGCTATEQTVTGHCPMGTHAVRLRILPDGSCQSCMEEGEVETLPGTFSSTVRLLLG